MAKYGLCLLALALVFTACGGGSAGATPKATFEAMKAAGEKKDGGALYDLLSPDAQKKVAAQLDQMKATPVDQMQAEVKKQMEEQFGMTFDEMKKMSARDFMAKMFAKMSDEDLKEVKDTVFVSEKIDGDKAVVTTKQGDTEDTLQMVKIDGKWFLADFD